MSTMIFDKIIYDKINAISLILFLIGVGFMFIPVYTMIGGVFKNISCLSSGDMRKEKNYRNDYNQFRTKFQTEYARANPITRTEGMREYFQFLNRMLVFDSRELQEQRGQGEECQFHVGAHDATWCSGWVR